MKVKIISLLLLTALSFSMFAACSENKSETVDETTGIADDDVTVSETETETEPAIKDDLPELDYGGESVRILARAFERYKDELMVDEFTGDVINDAVYQRALDVQERLNVKLDVMREEAANNSHGPIELVTKTILAGDDAYDVFVGSMFNSMSSSVNGYWKNMYEIENLDLDKPYWSTYYNEKASIGNKLYAITGDLAFSMIRLLSVTFCNLQLVEDYNMGNLYNVVLDGNWTIDYEIELVKDIYEDINGDGISDKDDFFGLGTSDTFATDAYTSSFDLQMIGKDSENYLTLNIDMDKFATAVEKINNMCWNTPGVSTHPFYGADDEMNDIARNFSQNKYVFMSSWIFSSELEYMRDMQDDYGILPFPKFDEEQENYYSYANDQFSVFVIPVTVGDDRTPIIGAVLEALCSVSKNTVLESYYEIALKSKYSRDSESAEMLDLIVSGFKLDAAWMYCVNTGSLSQNMMRNQIRAKQNNVVSDFAKNEQKYITSIDTLIEKFKVLE